MRVVLRPTVAGPHLHLIYAPSTVVAGLDVPDQLVTCCYLVIAPDTPEVTVCSAGPVLVTGHQRAGSRRRFPSRPRPLAPCRCQSSIAW
ncbi:hypothetical protein F7Q99_26830 [Streptomyces kaniharaensis]|uniref:Uncharacterized protein n=1 Tax=Streptomyces kaniharaensis TaxID=212423 RepID=A0A6N7L1W9_9ACTN|nr:hypothetical protein [Streptomyces kaniharaensis]